uniref:Uncharacterized protein n=1 Tax=Rhizophora mucronata TaxID=61149 RepID=A0A2P2PZ00_RHIMU
MAVSVPAPQFVSKKLSSTILQIPFECLDNLHQSLGNDQTMQAKSPAAKPGVGLKLCY